MTGSKSPERGADYERSQHGQQDDDSATMKASEDLKHTSISERYPATETHKPVPNKETSQNQTSSEAKATTPERPADLQVPKVGVPEPMPSPKKKRVREQDDEAEAKEGEDAENTRSRVPSNSSSTSADRSGPSKKRPRDTVEDETKVTSSTDEKTEETKAPETSAKSAEADQSSEKTSTKASEKPSTDASEKLPQTSPSAFASSGFGAFAASSTSGFGALAGKPSVFGGSKDTVSPFGALAAKSTTEAPKPTLGGFGSANGSTAEKSASPFGALGSAAGSGPGIPATTGLGGGSGGTFGSGFGSGLAPSKKLSNFSSGKPDPSKPAKPAKAFGAPESDLEDGSDDENEGEGAAGSDNDNESVAAEDKKKPKLTKVPQHSGEEDEVTLLQLRAKLFTVAKNIGWKERGVGALKVNVHKSCVEYDEETGSVVPNSFDVSLREDSEPVIAARLLMRQESTHKVILNTPIVPALNFDEKPGGAVGKQYMFTGFDGPTPANMLLKMNEANGPDFISTISQVKSGLL